MSQTDLLILDAKIQKQRLRDMKEAAKRRKINVSESYGNNITHIVTEFKDLEAVQRKLGLSDIKNLDDVEVVSVVWFTESMRAGHPVPVTERHRIQSAAAAQPERSNVTSTPLMAEYACQRATPLRHHNEKFTEGLEILERHAELRDGDHDYSRALAFRRASCVLKCLPFTLTNIQQLRNVTNIGDHSRRIIQEILEEGESEEVENIRRDPWFNKMKLFSSVFGIGPSKSKQWIERGWTTIKEAQEGYTSSDWRVQWGLAFHDDLTTPVSRQEADYILSIVKKHLDKILPGAELQLTGGFRRGKTSGHDVDILITHSEEGREIGTLPRLLHSLQSHDIILCGKHENSSYSDDVLTKDFKLTVRGQLDHFEKWLGIFKVPKRVREQSVKSDNVSVVDRRVHSNENAHTAVSAKSGDKLGNSTTETEECVEHHTQNVSVNDKSIPNGTDDNMNVPSETLDHTKHVHDINTSSLDDLQHSKIQRSNKSPLELNKEPRDWLARRVDLIVSPYSQYFYALVGWTGNKQFNRDLRWYAQRELGMKVTSHGVYDFNKGKKVAAGSEKEVFDILQLPYREPWERNC